ncbi:MAG: MBL fold metallo-hydrolase [Acidobacteriota bacterium]
MITLFESGEHKSIYFDDLSSGSMIQANQHLIAHGDEAMILDPGGHKVHSALFALISSAVPMRNLKHIFFSHQDPDIIAAANAWLMMSDAQAYLPMPWVSTSDTSTAYIR